MKRVRLIHVCLITLLSPLIFFSTPKEAPAQRNNVTVGGQRPPRGKPFIGYHNDLPPEVVKKPRKQGRASDRQTVDLTPNTPGVDDTHPHWSRNEQFIVFQSNRTDINGAQPPGTLTHIYRMSAGGGTPTALTGPLATPAIGASTSQSEPALNPVGNLLVYIERDAAGVPDLVELNLTTRTTRSLLRVKDPSFTGLNNPEYGVVPGGNVGVIFAGQKGSGQPYKLYAVDTQSAALPVQLTFGASDDRNPTLSPSDPADPNRLVIAFDSNRTNAAGTTTGPTRDIWAIGINPAIQNAVRLTDFSAGGQRASNIQPSWSTNKIDQVNGSQSFINGQQLIAFASTRYDSTGNGNADGINPNGTHDIYWLKVNIVPDASNPSVYTVTNPESTLNPALKLVTSDPNHIYNDLHPSWPQFIQTYQVAYQSDRTFYDAGANSSGPAGQPNDIFASNLLDINAPTLVRFDRVTGDILKIEPRLATPGSTVKISVKLFDYETGIRDVWAQIKNPNSKYQSADGREHKVYVFAGLNLNQNTTVLNVPVEYESQRIFIGNDPNDPRVNTYANPTYVASISDFFAFSGLDNPPDEGWLQLQLESRDPATGISTYSATWRTDIYPTDYYVDIIAYDNAVDPFSAEGSNWKIYDNVWGFTTQSFSPGRGILFVSDHAAGQKFFRTRLGATTLTNVNNPFWGTESWMTDIDVNLLPTQYISGTTLGTMVLVLNALGVKSYGASYGPDIWTTRLNTDPLTLDGTAVDGADLPVTQQYDIWRILCRGPVPDAVLQQYAPNFVQQPPDLLAGETQPRIVRDVPRCVIWHAPFTGNLFVGAGSITDLAVQNQLSSFLAGGGRIFFNGQDIGWALTLDGSSSNTFFTNVLRAQYITDAIPGTLYRFDAGPGFPLTYLVDPTYAMTAAGIPNPITYDPWSLPKYLARPVHQYPGPPDPPLTQDYVSSETKYFTAGPDANTPRTYGSPAAFFPDHVRPLSGAVADITYNGTQNSYMIHYEDTTTGQRVVYCAGGLEALFPDFFNPPNTTNTIALKNRRTEILHNAVCWMRTGIIFGQVRDLEGGNPLPNVLVRLSNQLNNQGQPITAYTAITAEDGTFFISGVMPDIWEVSAFKAGFIIQKRTFAYLHGGHRADVSFRMTPAEPAVIKGRVTLTDGTTPVVGAVVTATDNLDASNVFTATSDANGDYSIERVPSQTTYTLRATASGFGESIPVSYPVPNPNDPIPGQRDTVVQSAKVYVGFNFQMKPIPGGVTGRVLKRADNSPIAGALVTATQGTASFTAITDANGEYRFDQASSNGLDPGIWALVATAPGYSPNPAINVTVISDQTVVAEDILLDTIPPGSVSGLVTRTSDNQPEAGVRIELRDAGGNLIASGTTVAPQTVGGYTFNFKITNVPAGATYTATASKTGFTPSPASRNVTVASNQETQNVNFQLEPLHTFSGALSLVSAPYNYTQDAGDLLSIPAADRGPGGPFRLATWTGTGYAYYPNAPANAFQLGRGYFMAYKSNIPLSTEGTPAPPAAPFDIALRAGWNLVGNPFPFEIDWTKVKVVHNGNVIAHDAAVAQGLIGAALYTYVGGGYVLDFRIAPWRGYWVRAFHNVALRIDPQTDRPGRAAKSTGGTGRAVLRGGDGWSVNLRVKIGEHYDEGNYFGVTSRAVDGYDPFKSEKPPIVGDQYAYLAFDHANWGDRSGAYGIDLRSASTAPKTWEFSVQTNIPNSTAILSWPNAAAAGRNVTLTLTDLTTGQMRDLRTNSSYTWNTGETPATRRFKIEAITLGRGQHLRVTNILVKTGSESRAAGMSIGYNLSVAANVDIRILGANGAQVRRLIGRATRAAGLNEVTWDRKNDRGVVMPAGSYTVEIRAQTTDGRQTIRAIQPFLLTR